MPVSANALLTEDFIYDPFSKIRKLVFENVHLVNNFEHFLNFDD